MKKAQSFIKTLYKKDTAESAFSLVEVLLAISLLLMITIGVVSVVAYAQDVRSSAQDRPYAVSLAGEGIEVVRGLRGVVASEVPDGTYAIERSGDMWMLVEGQEIIADTYTREISVTTIGTAIRQIEATVSWNSRYGGERSVVLSTLLSDWGAVVGGRWQFPVLESSFDLPGNRNGLKIVAEGGNAYVIKDSGNGTLVSLDVGDISNPSVLGAVDVVGWPRGIALSGNYIYVAATEKDSEFQVYDATVPGSPTLVDSHDPSHRQPGLSVTVDGNYAYLGREAGKEQELWIYNVSDPGNILVEGILNVEGSILDSVRYGDYLAIATDDRNQEVKLVDVSEPGSPVLAGGFDLPGNAAALSCALYGDNLVVGLEGGEVYILDIVDPAAIAEVGVFDAGGAVRDIAVDTDDGIVFLGTDENSAELQIVDITSPAQPSQVGLYDASADINGVWYDESRDCLYAVGDGNTEELMIFLPE